jgi:hypothetical protein
VSKKIVMYIVYSVVTSIVMGIGAFFNKTSGPDKVMLVIKHPDGCFLVEPNALAAGTSTDSDIVSVPVGKNTFKFDCDGKPYTVEKEVEAGHLIWTVDPTGKDPAKSDDPSLNN